MENCKSCAGGCGGDCGSCSGCARELILGPGEVALLKALGQFSFLPVARKADDMTPIFKEYTAYSPEEYSLIIQLLEKKQLIYLDYLPLPGANMAAYVGYPVHGSMGLTQRGIDVLEQIELLGVES